jgi:hypothetical protein
MSYQKAIGSSSDQKGAPYSESPLQNHYISAISKGGNPDKTGKNAKLDEQAPLLDWEEMFSTADAKEALAKRNQNSDIQVSMTHASDFESQ